MKFKKPIILAMLTFFLLFSITCVCASDINENPISNQQTVEVNDLLSADDSDSPELEKCVSSDSTLSSSNEEILKIGSKSFSDLNSTINGEQTEEVYLNDNYTYNPDTDLAFIHGITINRPLNVYGNGVTIDGANAARIFNVMSDQVNFYNITFVNCLASGDYQERYGGAISDYKDYGNSTAINCIFINNHAIIGGAKFGGRAINCSFINNQANEGGAMADWSTGICSATNCIFIGNSARGYGGAMYRGYASNSIFVNNHADVGGAIYTVEAINCTFICNSAYEGGAGYRCNATNCNFINNHATDNYSVMNYGNAINCNFIANENFDVTHDEYCTLNSIGTLSASDFITSYGSGERFMLTLNAGDNQLEGVHTNVTIKNSNFEKSFFALSGEGFVVDLKPGVYEVTLSYYGSDEVIAPVTRTLTVTDGTTFWDLNKKINGNTASEITLDKDYAYNETTDYYFSSGIVIGRSLTINGQGHKIDAKKQARIFEVRIKTVIENLTLANGKSESYSGAIYSNGNDLSLSNCTFVNNTGNSGGAINCGGWDNYISDCDFINNSANSGGAIYWSPGWFGGISNCNFLDNWADKGGAIYLMQGNSIETSMCSFINNKAENDGGAFYSDFAEDNVINGCIFINNDATSIIYSFYKCIKINNNIFLNHTKGSEISFSRADDTSNIDCNWFGNNVKDFDDEPTFENALANAWLFLNATADPNTIPVSGSSDITFKLYLYNKTSQKIMEYDNNLLKPVNLTITSINGNVDKNVIKLGDSLRYTAASEGSGIVTAHATVNCLDEPVVFDENAEVLLKINKADSSLSLTSIAFDYGSSGSAAISYSGATGVKASVVGQPNAKVNVKGNIIEVSGLNAGTYTLSVTTIADANHNPVTKTAAITVNKLNTALSASAKTFKFEDKTKKYTVTLKDKNGASLKNTQVTLKVNGVTYKATTNANGAATFALKKLTKKGSFDAVINYQGDKNYKSVSKKVKVTVKAPVFKTVSKGSKDKATVKKIQRALKKNGFYIKEKGHYLKVDGIYHKYTVKAVKQFQKAKKLKVTGKVDYTTAKKLKII